MKTHRVAFVVSALLPLVMSGPAGARVSGGSDPSTDCYVEFDGVTATGTVPSGKPLVSCQDGDPSCDTDGQANGVCTFSITACAFQADVSGCTAQAVVKYTGNASKLGLPLPATGLTAATCASAGSVQVKLKGKKHNKPGKKKVKVIARAGDKSKDKNIFFLGCTAGGGTTTTTIPGGGGNCPNNPAGGPRELDYVIADHGTDLDTGFSGQSHNFPVIAGASLKMCLTECDGCTNSACKAVGPTGADSINSATFGPPLPLFAARTPVCVVNRFKDPMVQGTANVADGTFDSTVGGTATPINLLSDVFSTFATQVCPKCTGASGLGTNGHCDSGPNDGKSCTVNGMVRVVEPSSGINDLYPLSNDCPPGGLQGSKTGTVPVSLPVTTASSTITGSKHCPGQLKDDACGDFGVACTVNCEGQADVKGGLNQWCCGDAQKTPCFPTAPNSGEPNHAIVRTGKPVVPAPACPDATLPKTGSDASTVATFCISTSGSGTVDQVAGLPGPGAVIFNGVQTWLANQ
jgi:hypothetical protein